ncbi:protease S8 tripeptidyl peptidase I [Cordyceps javanica]|uniref:tripeptidyl-peptidase II n=1 Tax=Cordyceps javanica TaxID=43265 RepID=A0A545VTL1_9HYPO|nr:protease S8 tripeptidyl peptidase I [Cordyceps javanica]TQW05024.1 protease S8 tripeptidyl peptidase I [Cordyceps javanica]
MKAELILLGSLVAGAVAAPLTDNHIVHERRSEPASSVFTKRAAEADTELPVRIALKQRNIEKGSELLFEVSDPKSANYGKHYTADQVIDLFAPKDSSIQAVKQWLIDSGIPSGSIKVPRSKGWVQFKTTAGQLESILKTKYHVYKNSNVENIETIGTEEYSLPAEIAEHVEFVHPGVAHISRRVANNKHDTPGKLPVRKTQLAPSVIERIKKDPGDLTQCDKIITPACIQALYQISNGTLSDPNNKLGIFAFQSTNYAKSDLDHYWQTYAPRIPQGTYPVNALIDGASGADPDPKSADEEAEIDIQSSFPIIYPQGAVFYNVNGKNGLLNQFLDAIDGSYIDYSADGETGDDPDVDGDSRPADIGKFKPTNVISISYGWGEVDGDAFPFNYEKRQCDEFMKLGLQGVSVLFSSGDDGVAWRGGSCLGKNGNVFVPGYPANCPYITSVGATVIPPGASIKDKQPEVVSQSFSPGGGFSNIYPTPDYQKDAVAAYFAKHDPGYKYYTTTNGTIPENGGIYNRAGRGYPDVSAIGDNTAFYAGGADVNTGGTSESAPIVAAMITRVNEERIAIGKKPLGFLNPALYSHPEIFNDITSGDQRLGGPDGDDQPSECGNNGFSAVPGWDPVTGLGTPNYPRLLKALKDL